MSLITLGLEPASPPGCYTAAGSTVRRVHYTYAEYLALEEESSVRHEYLDGEIYAMAGGSPDHAALAAALISAIRSRLPRGCRMFTSDLRVRVPATGLSTYPDAAVVCGRERATDDALAVVNPLLLVEVTSPSTEEYDRNEKLRHYKNLSSLREVLIASHREPQLTLHQREDSGWSVATAERGRPPRSSFGRRAPGGGRDLPGRARGFLIRFHAL